MAKNKSSYVCAECGGISHKWQGQCPHCGAWNSLSETIASTNPRFNRAQNHSLAPTSAEVVQLSAVNPEESPRLLVGIPELDRVLGGGLVPGGVILLGGDPGIGKSTLLLQSLAKLAQERKVLYVTGEESIQQVALRAARLGITAPLSLLAEVRLEAILSILQQQKPEVVVIDSIQTLFTEILQSAPGSVAQVRECAAMLTRYAKEAGATLLLVGHVTKDGAIAGPRVLEHIVDAVLYFEGDTHSAFRLIRAVKNRFGAANELGVFAMTERGLREVSNPSALFLSKHAQPASGSTVFAGIEGSRPLLIEIQALTSETSVMPPRRLAVGLEGNRLALLLAVMQRQLRCGLGNLDVFVNAVGGMRLSEPATDLAVVLAIYSSLKNRPLRAGLVVFGEIGLAGEVRPVQRGADRIKEAAKLGFTAAIVPAANQPKQAPEGIEVLPVQDLVSACEYALLSK